ncbi:MAG TPA: threonine--tRNA ligase [Thermoplasmata archaeon]|nr:threonine--tRNA ligase [Thermoplasmata archaeon]
MGSASVHVRFPDSSSAEFPADLDAGAILSRWRSEATGTLAARLDGHPIDLSRPITADGSLAPLTFDDRAGKEVLHHSAAHIVAKAVMAVVPEARPTVGPGTEEGFHYDFDMRPLVPDDLDRIRAKVRAIVEADEPFRREVLSRDRALELFRDNPHKQQYIAAAPATEEISVYRTGDWPDLCRGPHVPSTRWLRGIHLLGFSGVTQGGAPDGLPLQRIRGVAFPTAPELEQYLKLRREAEHRDHRVLGPRLELFTFVDEAPGFPFWLPKGMIVLRELEAFVSEHLHEASYEEIRTPLMFAASVFQTSGHWEHYREDMFLTSIDDRPYGIKPMNCPGAMLVFRSRSRSYRELPLRLAEWAPLHRLEASGTIHGMTRVREFIQDDAHIFLTEEQIGAEVRTLLAWIDRAFSTFHLTWSYELSTRPEKFLGRIEDWDRAEATLRSVLDASGVAYRVSLGEGAFYGPKIDLHIRDSLGRSWQTGTIQVDYQQPERFGLQYQGADGTMHTPIVVHRTILGSFERFLGILLEHTNGRLPPWLAPIQVRVLPIADRHQAEVDRLVGELKAAGLRADARGAEETISKRIRAGELEKIPYLAVIGDAELDSHTVTVRVHGDKQPRKLAPADLVTLVKDRIASRAYEP